MKYIVIEMGGLEQIIIFAKSINHDEMAGKLKGKVLSAGFVTRDWKTHGGSISLGLESRKEDQLLLEMIMNL